MPVEVEELFAGVCIKNDGANGEAKRDVLRPSAITIGALALLPAARSMNPCIAIVNKGIDVAISDREDRAPPTPVTTAGTTLGDELLATKRRHAIATLSGMDLNDGFVDELHEKPSVVERPAPEG